MAGPPELLRPALLRRSADQRPICGYRGSLYQWFYHKNDNRSFVGVWAKPCLWNSNSTNDRWNGLQTSNLWSWHLRGWHIVTENHTKCTHRSGYTDMLALKGIKLHWQKCNWVQANVVISQVGRRKFKDFELPKNPKLFWYYFEHPRPTPFLHLLWQKITLFKNFQGIVAGWGVTLLRRNEQTSVLRKAVVPIFTNKRCRQNAGDEVITERMLCAGYRKNNGLNACQVLSKVSKV